MTLNAPDLQTSANTLLKLLSTILMTNPIKPKNIPYPSSLPDLSMISPIDQITLTAHHRWTTNTASQASLSNSTRRIIREMENQRYSTTRNLPGYLRIRELLGSRLNPPEPTSQNTRQPEIDSAMSNLFTLD